MWYSNDMFRYMFKAEFVALASLKVPSGKSKIGAASCNKIAVLLL